jgi:DNA-binding transcriptional LysR family regulator
MIDWDDLRFVLAVARAGSALRAAGTLKVNQTTVMRRIARIQADIGADLFETKQNGQTLTPLGQGVMAAAERIESEVIALQSALAAQQRVLTGSVRFTSSEVFANGIVAPCLRTFRKQHPGVTIQLFADDRVLDLSRGEADVALRAGSRPQGGGIVAQRLPDSAWTIYCSRAYADEHGAPEFANGLEGHAIIGMDGAISHLPAVGWLARTAPNASITTRSNSLTNLVSAVKAGLGVGALPCFVGDGDADLLRCCPPIRQLNSEVWLVIREDIKQAPHVRAFADYIAAHMHGMRAQLAGTPDRPRAD